MKPNEEHRDHEAERSFDSSDLERRIDDLLEGELALLGDVDDDLAAQLSTAKRELERDREVAARSLSPVREGALVARILSRTSRENLGPLGELRLVGGFVRDRLASSPLLKVVAASLLLHVVAFPMAAYFLVRAEPDPEPRITFEIPVGDDRLDSQVRAPEEEPEPLAEPHAPAGLEVADVARIENVRARSRWVLSTLAARSGEAPLELRASEPDGRLERKLLWERSRLLAERFESDWLDDEQLWEGASPLSRAIWAGVLLDRYVLTGERPPLLARALNDLSLGDGGPLVALTLDRARALGVWRIEGAFEFGSAPLPLSTRWWSALESELEAAGLAEDPVVLAFRGWIRD